MSLNTVSSQRFDEKGDFTTHGGMLGMSHTTDIAASATLWSIAPRYNRYILNPTAGGVVITLPAIGNAAFEAETGVQHGFDIFIKNNSATNSLALNSDGAVLVTNISAGQSAHISADINSANDWYIIGIAASDSGDIPSIENLQDAYDESGAGVPKIQLSAANGGLTVQDNATETAEPLSVKKSDGTTSLLTVRNVTPGTDTPALEALGGSSSASGAVAIGDGAVSSAAGSVTITDGSAAVTNADAGSKLEMFPGGFKQLGGATQVGTANSDPYNEVLFFKAENVATTSGSATTINVLTMDDNTSYRILITAIGRDVDDSTTETFTGEVTYAVLTGTATYDINFLGRNRYRGPSIGSFGDITLTNTGSTLECNVYGSQNVTDGAAGFMNFVIEMTVRAYTIA